MISDKEYFIILRKRKKITHMELAKYLKISQSYISLYENSKRVFSKQLEQKYREYIENK
ncbi:helix-turn-helix domain-containing protein [Caldifermentibacillus hisashii]|uniref:helix-turn-helix domain-containing protein n=1 Tax=Caldifermentibacillus hisashii TaxID=996558 RepID=UPI003D1559DB